MLNPKIAAVSRDAGDRSIPVGGCGRRRSSLALKMFAFRGSGRFSPGDATPGLRDGRVGLRDG